jgi:hypothetical protein
MPRSPDQNYPIASFYGVNALRVRVGSCLDSNQREAYGPAPSDYSKTRELRAAVPLGIGGVAPAGEDERMNRCVGLCAAVLLSLAGCAHQTETRLQAEDDSDRKKEAEVQTIGDVTVSIANANPTQVSGVGLVVGLDGTGGGASPGGYRTWLEDDLRKQQVSNIKEVLASPNTSLVLVTALIPAGCQKGDPLDVEVTLPRESKTTSLRGGRLLACNLYEYGNTKQLDPNTRKPEQLLRGHCVAVAEGPLLVGLGDGDGSGELRHGRIWGGGRSRIDRTFYLEMKDKEQRARVVQAVADRINETFHGTVRGPMTDLAVAKTRALVFLAVAPQYRLNLPRYLRVVRHIPLWETEASRIPYQRHLEQQLLDPRRSVVAALRLEAIGQDSIPTLKKGLASDSPLVRFCSAEALAYLGSPSCGMELARTIREQPVLRAFSLTALASLDEAVSHVELRKLMDESSAETRYGAFRALRALDEHEDAVQGEQLNESFWLHRVAPESRPLVHLSTSKRPEIVVFGQNPSLLPPFAIRSGDYTVTANDGDQQCTITRFSLKRGRMKNQCSLQLEDVLHTLAQMGAIYPDVVEVIRRVDHQKCLNCLVAVDALPQATDVYDLAKAGAGDPELLKTHPEILGAKADFGATPTLFEKSDSGRERSRDAEKEAASE